MNPRTQDDYPKGSRPYPGDKHKEAQRQTIETSTTHGRKPPRFPMEADNPEHGNEATFVEYGGTSINTKERGNDSGTRAKAVAQPVASFKKKGYTR